MCELGDKEPIVVELLAFESNTVATLAFWIHYVSVVDAKKHFRPLRRDESQFRSICPITIIDVALCWVDIIVVAGRVVALGSILVEELFRIFGRCSTITYFNKIELVKEIAVVVRLNKCVLIGGSGEAECRKSKAQKDPTHYHAMLRRQTVT